MKSSYDIIIIEGGDCSGKTTLIKDLSAALSVLRVPSKVYDNFYMHEEGKAAYRKICQSPCPKEQFDAILRARDITYMSHIQGALDKKELIIYDRSWLSSVVYQCIVPEKDAYSPGYIGHYSDYYNDIVGINRTLTVYCTADESVIEERLNSKANKDSVELRGLDYQRKIRNAFQEAMENNYVHTDKYFIYDTTDTSIYSSDARLDDLLKVIFE